jgi:erythronate-4-phosphate dehydrogenase
VFDSRDLAGLQALLQTAEILLCRSTINVNAALLEGTPVRFVATATSGTDHFDTEWLDAKGIAYASAAGSNARSVAEWWAAALLELYVRGRIRLPDATVGIVGVGHVGTQVADVARALGMQCRFNDPPRALRGELPVTWSGEQFVAMEEILDCDIVTLHVPLTRDGEYPTAGFFGERQFVRLRPGALFVNTSRGAVMEPSSVLRWTADGNPTALDVYPDEPRIDPALVRAADIATPHIAGHAHDGKLLGTQMVYNSLCGWMGVDPVWRYSQMLDALWHEDTKTQRLKKFEKEDLSLEISGDVYREVLDVVRSVYDVRVDDAALRRAVEMEPEAAAAEFARLRAEYPIRRQFASCAVEASAVSSQAAVMLRAAGFKMR